MPVLLLTDFKHQDLYNGEKMEETYKNYILNDWVRIWVTLRWHQNGRILENPPFSLMMFSANLASTLSHGADCWEVYVTISISKAPVHYSMAISGI